MKTVAAAAAVTLSLGFVVACGGDDDPEPTPAADGPTVTVKASNALKFDKAEYTTEAGDVTFVYENEGTTGHTLLIKEVDGFKLAIGDTDQGTVKLAAGTYTIFCDIAGHGSMKATVTVT